MGVTTFTTVNRSVLRQSDGGVVHNFVLDLLGSVLMVRHILCLNPRRVEAFHIGSEASATRGSGPCIMCFRATRTDLPCRAMK